MALFLSSRRSSVVTVVRRSSKMSHKAACDTEASKLVAFEMSSSSLVDVMVFSSRRKEASCLDMKSETTQKKVTVYVSVSEAHGHVEGNAGATDG